jgi:peptidoglycan/LPS O-acetylase OafA/YrhL
VSLLIAGAIALAYSVAALFFLRFWKETRDRLFAMFAIAFAVLAANRVLLSYVAEPHEARTWHYLVRLLAFLLILAAVVDKNRGRR